MRLLPHSLYGRMLLLSAIATAIALAIAAFAITRVLERFVIKGIDDRLDTSLIMMRQTVDTDGKLDAPRVIALSPAFTSGDGWLWRIDTPHGSIGADIEKWRTGERALPRPPRPDRLGRDSGFAAMRLDGRLNDGTPFHGRQLVVETAGGPVTLLATAPRRLIDRPIGQAILPLLATLAILGALLAIAAVVQLRLGLRPLVHLRAALGRVRSGTATRIPGDQPDELRPLAAELNALLDQNDAALANARGHVANLAHGLKTPLATLALELRAPDRDPDGTLTAQVARIDGAIRHHLGRARADAAGGPRPRVALAPAIEGLIAALAHIHADRRIAATSTVAPDLSVAIDPHDLDELLGNLLDNAWRFAASRVTIAAAAQDRMVRVTITDDGPGIPPASRDAAMQPGRRLDEAGDGHGFGLSIARELAELNGGRLALDDRLGGGLAATVDLPR